MCTSQTCEAGQGATLPSALSVAPSSYGLPASPIHATAAPSPPHRMQPIPSSTQTALEPFVSQSSFHDMFLDACHDIHVYRPKLNNMPMSTRPHDEGSIDHDEAQWRPPLQQGRGASLWIIFDATNPVGGALCVFDPRLRC